MCGIGRECMFASGLSGLAYSSVMCAKGFLVVMELAAPARGFAGVWAYLVVLPPVFLLFRLECAPSPLAL